MNRLDFPLVLVLFIFLHAFLRIYEWFHINEFLWLWILCHQDCDNPEKQLKTKQKPLVCAKSMFTMFFLFTITFWDFLAVHLHSPLAYPKYLSCVSCFQLLWIFCFDKNRLEIRLVFTSCIFCSCLFKGNDFKLKIKHVHQKKGHFSLELSGGLIKWLLSYMHWLWPSTSCLFNPLSD